MPKALINGINLYYEDNGSGFPVVFTHGYAGTTKSWDGQVATFSRKYRFITYDIRGHGNTDTPDNLSKYTLDIVIEDIYQLLRHLGIQKAVIGGLSLGGYLTLHFYNQHPDMTVAIVLMDTGPGYRTPENAKDWNKRCVDCARILETEGMRGFLESEYSIDDYYTTPDVMMKHNPRGLANIRCGVMINPWGLDILPNIMVPALVICGDRDAAFLPATDYMVQKIPVARKVIIADAGHGVNIDQPHVFESTVLDFLNDLKLGS
ncbi:alpha/beta fold hydrolase [Candidatus Omnitrophota bacterium]